MLANLDGVADNRVLEIKTARTAKGWGEEGSDLIPLPYLIQVQHYMAVTAFPVADVAVLIGGSDFRLYEVPADAELQAGIIEQEAELWGRIQRRDPPDPVTFAEVRKRFGRSAAVGTIEASGATFTDACELQRLVARIKDLEEQADDRRANIMRALGEKGDTLVHSGNVIATWKLAKAPQRFDSKGFAKEHPELAAQFTHAGEPSRRLLLKEIPE
jgi:predicted phage-related endonuclease